MKRISYPLKQIFVKDYWKFLISYVQDNKKWFKNLFLFFLGCFAVGAVAFLYRPDLMDAISRLIKDLIGESPGLDFNLVLTIFFHNLQSAVLAMLGGILFGLAPLLIIGITGVLLGFVSANLFKVVPAAAGFKILLILSAVVPHGIFEVPAILIAAVLGCHLGWDLIKRQPQGRGQIFKRDFAKIFKFFPVIAAVLFIAAITEVYITPVVFKILVVFR